MHRGGIWQFSVQLIHYGIYSESTEGKIGKFHLRAM